MSIDCAGRERVAIAQSTWCTSVGSTSSSTTINVFAEIGAGRALRRERHDLRGVTSIHLPDRDDRNAPAGGFRDRPHALDSGHPELLQVGPDPRFAQPAHPLSGGGGCNPRAVSDLIRLCKVTTDRMQ